MALGCGDASTPAPEATPNVTNNEPDPEQPPTLQPVEQPATAEVSFTHVITAETAYYTGGPQQGRPPDGNFLVGTKVNLAKGDDGSDAPTTGSYTLVRSEDGIEAYVSTDALETISDKEE